MQVRAIRLGFYGNRRRKVGTVFSIKDEQAFSKHWMEKVEKGKAGKSKAKAKSKDVYESELGPSPDDQVI